MNRFTSPLALVALSSLLAAAARAAEPNTIEGLSEPAAKIEVPSVMRGKLAELLAQEGKLVKAGDILARLDSQLQQATIALQDRLATSTTEIDYAKTAEKFAANEYERYKTSNAVTPVERESKKLAFDQADAYVKKAQEGQIIEQLKLAREKLILEQMTIKSPIDGYVHRVNKQAGESIDENQPLLVIVQTSKINVNFFVHESHWGEFTPDQKVSLTFGKITRDATIIAIDPFVDPAGHLFRVKIQVDNSDNKLTPGSPATWKIK